MARRLIPFYREMGKNNPGFTLFLDTNSGKVYKAYHKKVNQLIYWVAFVLVLALLRSIQPLNLLTDTPLALSILLLLELTISFFIGYKLYKSYYFKELKEVFFDQTMLQEYIISGKRMLKIDLIATVSSFVVFALALALFLLTYWIIWYLLSFLMLVLTDYMLCSFSRDRFKLYKRG
ncbi:hypothetical protein ABNN70_00575 [Sporolactobacillus sp. Y61]|uniref:DUF3278 domain-containing protein n=1 Tax=Sporolactobacillus sp. Y61 TaxID=3160863 RepID=A0AAU8IG78_9BACL|nr:hypothetical protein [Sporolactobacillus sp. THM19-2]RYL87088.1 hypothetical protein EWH91_13430 [Sporolactobacillus sp. THM19-2]